MHGVPQGKKRERKRRKGRPASERPQAGIATEGRGCRGVGGWHPNSNTLWFCRVTANSFAGFRRKESESHKRDNEVAADTQAKGKSGGSRVRHTNLYLQRRLMEPEHTRGCSALEIMDYEGRERSDQMTLHQQNWIYIAGCSSREKIHLNMLTFLSAPYTHSCKTREKRGKKPLWQTRSVSGSLIPVHTVNINQPKSLSTRW